MKANKYSEIPVGDEQLAGCQDGPEHTPEPWRVHLSVGCSPTINAGGELYRTLAVATVDSENMADAYLIAKAPETAEERDKLKLENEVMRVAIEDQIEWLKSDGFVDSTHLCIESAIQALTDALPQPSGYVG